MFLAKNRLKLVKNNTFFIVILLWYSYFIDMRYMDVGNIIDLVIDIIIKYPPPLFCLLFVIRVDGVWIVYTM
jgi:hypothetical protein